MMIGTEGEETDRKSIEDDEIPTLEFASEQNQEARAFLRERFLRTITGIVGKTCDLQMYNNTKVTAEFRGSDVNIANFYVTQLKTALGVLPHAVLRTKDIISLEVKNTVPAEQDKMKTA